MESSSFLAEPRWFRLSPLIVITLINLYLALTVPLPILAQQTGASVSPFWLFLGVGLGLILLLTALSETVVVDAEGIAVSYPVWVPAFWRRGWHLDWQEIVALRCRTTGQGGLVYYLLTAQGDRAYLLPMRVAGFNHLTQLIATYTGLDTQDIRPLAQPWMYGVLFLFTMFLWLVEGIVMVNFLF